MEISLFSRKKSIISRIYIAMVCAMIVLACGYIYHAYSLTSAIVAKASIVVSTDTTNPPIQTNLRTAMTTPSTQYETLASVQTDYCINMTTMSKIGLGSSILKIHKDWAPLGYDRFSELLEDHYFDGAKFFRVLKKFMAQVGINKDPAMTAKWRSKSIKDDPVIQSNKRGTISFATAGKNTRANQIFFNTNNNAYLDKEGFTPFGEVVDGMVYIDQLYELYGEGAPSGKGPNQGKANNQGNVYLDEFFPHLSYIVSTIRLSTCPPVAT